MYSKIVAIAALSAAPLVAAHGKTTVFVGDQGGNGTSFGIQGGSVPDYGYNYQTEVDTTIFWSTDINTDDDFGYTDTHGDNTMSDLADTVSLSGSTLAQVSAGGYVEGNWTTVTTDGAGPLYAIIDYSGSGKFSTATDLTVTENIPGDAGEYTGEIPAAAEPFQRMVRRGRRWLEARGVITRRATDVGVTQSFKISIPDDADCTGSSGGYDNLCVVKISNKNTNGPFGSILVVQQSNSTSSKRAARRATKFIQ